MSQRKVVIDIAADGTTKIDAQGFQGNACSVATRDLELALAGPAGADDDRKKPDYYATTGQANRQTN